MIYIKNQNICLLRVPKTGSTSLWWFLIENNLVDKEGSYSRRCDSIKYKKSLIPLDYSKNINKSHAQHSHMDVKYILENKVIPVNKDTKFVATIRNPIERLLSLYLYRCRKGEYQNNVPNKEDFKRKVLENTKAPIGCIKDHAWQMQFQHTFLNGTENPIWWCYDYLQEHLKEMFGDYKLDKLNVTNIKGKTTKESLSYFYDKELLEAVLDYWKDDYQLWKKVKKEYEDTHYGVTRLR